MEQEPDLRDLPPPPSYQEAMGQRSGQNENTTSGQNIAQPEENVVSNLSSEEIHLRPILIDDDIPVIRYPETHDVQVC